MSVNLNDVYAYISIFGFFFFLLKQLLKVANKTINEPHPLPVLDDFVKEYGYSYDYVMVYKVYDEDDETKLNPYQIKYNLRTVMERLKNAQLDTKCFYSCQRDEVYVKIRISPIRLQQEAARVSYRLLLDKDKLRAKLANGKKGKWAPIVIVDEKKLSIFQPQDYIHASYTINRKLDSIWKTYTHMEDKKHLFKGSDRIKLLITILEAKITENPPGCSLNVRQMLLQKAVLSAFPLHDHDELKYLQKKWLVLFQYPWKQPIHDVRDYFGERIGMYFLYLQHYNTMLFFIMPASLTTYIVKVVYGEDENFLMPYFAGVMILWCIVFMEFWKRGQSTIAMKWGVGGFEDEETDRPDFEGVLINSPITGYRTVYFPELEKFKRNQIALAVVFLCIVSVIGVVSLIFYFQYYTSQVDDDAFSLYITNIDYNFMTFIISILNTIVILTLNLSYKGLAIALNNYENWRTDTEYEDFLISKIFLFQLVNSYAAVTYVSFVKNFLGVLCIDNSCIGDVAATLSTIFLSSTITRAVKEFAVRKILMKIKDATETSGLEPGVEPTECEKQYTLSEYHVLYGTLLDYAGLTIQFGYTNLFVAAFPLAPALAFASSYIQMRIDGWKLCQACRRPQPRVAEDIGVWQDMLEILAMLAVVYNFALIFFTSSYLNEYTWFTRWLIYCVVEHIAFFLKYTLAAAIDDVPPEVDMQLERQKAFVSKIFHDSEDDHKDDFDETKSAINIIIHDTDYEWDYPEGSLDFNGDVGGLGGLISGDDCRKNGCNTNNAMNLCLADDCETPTCADGCATCEDSSCTGPRCGKAKCGKC